MLKSLASLIDMRWLNTEAGDFVFPFAKRDDHVIIAFCVDAQGNCVPENQRQGARRLRQYPTIHINHGHDFCFKQGLPVSRLQYINHISALGIRELWETASRELKDVLKDAAERDLNKELDSICSSQEGGW